MINIFLLYFLFWIIWFYYFICYTIYMDYILTFFSSTLLWFAFWDDTSLTYLTLNWILQHSGISMIYMEVFQRDGVFKVFTFIYLVFLWVIVDLILLCLWNRNKVLKFKVGNCFLLFFRYIPFFWMIWAYLVWASVSYNVNRYTYVCVLLSNFIFWFVSLLLIFFNI